MISNFTKWLVKIFKFNTFELTDDYEYENQEKDEKSERNIRYDLEYILDGEKNPSDNTVKVLQKYIGSFVLGISSAYTINTVISGHRRFNDVLDMLENCDSRRPEKEFLVPEGSPILKMPNDSTRLINGYSEGYVKTSHKTAAYLYPLGIVVPEEKDMYCEHNFARKDEFVIDRIIDITPLFARVFYLGLDVEENRKLSRLMILGDILYEMVGTDIFCQEAN